MPSAPESLLALKRGSGQSHFGLVIPLSRPRRALVLEWFVTLLAALACLTALRFSQAPLWSFPPAVLLVCLLCVCEQKRTRLLTENRFLYVSPFLPWQTGTSHPQERDDHYDSCAMTEQTGFEEQSMVWQPAELLQCWSNLFGLSMALKLQNCPHNESRSVRIMLWRCQVPPETYRRLCVMANWQIDRPQVRQHPETV